jgi:ABC-type Fe3+-siderophore transport system permease subunit
VPLSTVIAVLSDRLFGTQGAGITASDVFIVWNLRFRGGAAFAVGGGLAVAGAACSRSQKT